MEYCAPIAYERDTEYTLLTKTEYMNLYGIDQLTSTSVVGVSAV